MNTLTSISNFLDSVNTGLEPFVINILSNPLHYIGMFISILAALAFLTVIRGVFSILPHVIKIDGGSHHMMHSRGRAIWGMLLLFYYFALWEILKWVFSGFGGEPVASTVLIVAAALAVLVLSLRLLYPPKKGGGH